MRELEEDESDHTYQDVRDRDAERKQAVADYADKRNQSSVSQEREPNTGDLVLLEKKKENKLSAAYEEDPYLVTARYGDQIHIQSPRMLQSSTSA